MRLRVLENNPPAAPGPDDSSAVKSAVSVKAMGVPLTTKRTVGLLALQGDFDLHRKAVVELGQTTREVRTADELAQVDCLIMPGGESTTMRKLMDADGLTSPLRRFAETHLVMGTCAGLILLSKRVAGHPDELTLGLIDCDVARNAYGRQLYSFRETGSISLANGRQSFEMVFIRAPKITRLGENVEVLGRLHDQPTFVRQGNIICTTFHPELAGDNRIHEFLLSQL